MPFFLPSLASQYWLNQLNDRRCHSFTNTYVALSCPDSTLVFLFVHIRAKKNSFRYNPSFSRLAFLSLLLAYSLFRRNEPPLSRSFSRAHSSPTEINLMFSRISGLLISPPLIYRRRPCISTHKRGREPNSPHVPLTFVFRATPKPKTSVPRLSLI